jgi:hypothetical protein
MIGLLPCVAMCLLTVACSGSTDPTQSGNVLERLQSAQTVDDVDAAKCRESIPDAISATEATPVLATGRTTYREVTEAMRAQGGDAILTAVPKLAADAAVTLCVLDTRGMRFAPFRRSILAVSGDSFWWAGRQSGP